MACPDDDAPGRQYAQEVAASALKLGCSVSIVDTAALREKVANDVPADNGWDIADAVIASTDIAALRKAIASVTKPVDPPKAYRHPPPGHDHGSIHGPRGQLVGAAGQGLGPGAMRDRLWDRVPRSVIKANHNNKR